MRLVRPDAGRLARTAAKIVPIGDYFLFSFVGPALALVAIGSAITGLLNTGNPLFLLCLLPLVIFIIILASFFSNTHNFDGASAQLAMRAGLIMDKIRGTSNEKLALPLAKKIYQHSTDGHRYFGRCSNGLCNERIELLKALIPADSRTGDRSDINAAKRYIEMVEEAEKQHRLALKELGE